MCAVFFASNCDPMIMKVRNLLVVACRHLSQVPHMPYELGLVERWIGLSSSFWFSFLKISDGPGTNL